MCAVFNESLYRAVLLNGPLTEIHETLARLFQPGGFAPLKPVHELSRPKVNEQPSLSPCVTSGGTSSLQLIS